MLRNTAVANVLSFGAGVAAPLRLGRCPCVAMSRGGPTSSCPPSGPRALALPASGWHASDDHLKIVLEQWRTLASALPSVADVVIQAILPWCFTPEMYVDRPEFVDTLVDFVRGRPAQPVDAFVAEIDAAVAHDASAGLGEIDVPTLITFGARDLVCSPRSPSRSRAGSPGASWWSSTTCRTPGCTRIPRPSTAQHSTSCCASARDGPS
jgi:pimeloyl-ACP methyl ester carboxylesterase